jgi:hypothetical protein
MAQAYSQQEQAGQSEVFALDGKTTLRGTGIRGEKDHDHKLSLYGVESQHVLAQAILSGRSKTTIHAYWQILSNYLAYQMNFPDQALAKSEPTSKVPVPSTKDMDASKDAHWKPAPC